jgi:excisionase family DNA binding protein
MADNNFISTYEAAEILKCSLRTVQRMIARGRLHAKKLNPETRSSFVCLRQDVLDLAKHGPIVKTKLK